MKIHGQTWSLSTLVLYRIPFLFWCQTIKSLCPGQGALLLTLYIFYIRSTCLVRSLLEHYVWAAICISICIEHLLGSVIIEGNPLSVVIAYSVPLGCGGGNEMHMFWHSRTDSPLGVVSCTYVITSGFTLAKKGETVVSWQLYCELSWLVNGKSLTGLR